MKQNMKFWDEVFKKYPILLYETYNQDLEKVMKDIDYVKWDKYSSDSVFMNISDNYSLRIDIDDVYLKWEYATALDHGRDEHDRVIVEVEDISEAIDVTYGDMQTLFMENVDKIKLHQI